MELQRREQRMHKEIALGHETDSSKSKEGKQNGGPDRRDVGGNIDTDRTENDKIEIVNKQRGVCKSKKMTRYQTINSIDLTRGRLA